MILHRGRRCLAGRVVGETVRLVEIPLQQDLDHRGRFRCDQHAARLLGDRGHDGGGLGGGVFLGAGGRGHLDAGERRGRKGGGRRGGGGEGREPPPRQ